MFDAVGDELKMDEALELASQAMWAALRALDPAEVPVCEAPDVLRRFVDLERLAASGRMLMSARAAKAPDWRQQGFSSAAEWMAAQQGTSTSKAREDLATSGRLGELGKTRDAVRRGELSPDQAGRIADAAAVNPEAEDDLLSLAERESLRQLEQEAARRKAEVEAELNKRERERRIRKRRSAKIWYRDGEGFLKAQGPAADMRQFEQELNAAVSKLLRGNRPGDDYGERDAATTGRAGDDGAAGDGAGDGGAAAGGAAGNGAAGDGGAVGGGVVGDGPGGAASRPRESRNAIAFDALMCLMTGNAQVGSTSGAPARRGPRSMMLIRCDLAALVRGGLTAGEVCEIAGVGPISIAAARELLGDAALMLLLAHGEAIVDAVNLGRRPTVRQQVVRLWSTSTCSVEGCDRDVGLEFDHRDEYALTNVTVTDEMDPLCGHHHRLKTFDGWSLDPGIGRRAMRSPDDRARWDRDHGVAAPPPGQAEAKARVAERARAERDRARARRGAPAATAADSPGATGATGSETAAGFRSGDPPSTLFD